MVIGIDGGALSSGTCYGNERFTRELVKAVSSDTQNSYILYTGIPYTVDAPHISVCHIPFSRGWLQTRVAFHAMRCDRFLALNQAIPLLIARKTIAFHHGMAFRHFPLLYPDSARSMEMQTRLMALARTCVVPSEKVKHDMRHPNVHVMPYGVPEAFTHSLRYTKRKRIILSVGMDHPIKNYALLHKAFVLFQEKQEEKYQLVCIHSAHDAQLLRHYRDAHCLAVTSLYESFHFPTLEALAQNTPVVAVRTAVIPELEAYVSVVPSQPSGIAHGFAHPRAVTAPIAQQFSWKKYLVQLKKLYEE